MHCPPCPASLRVDNLLEWLTKFRKLYTYYCSFVIKDTNQDQPNEKTPGARPGKVLNAELLRPFPYRIRTLPSPHINMFTNQEANSMSLGLAEFSLRSNLSLGLAEFSLRSNYMGMNDWHIDHVAELTIQPPLPGAQADITWPKAPTLWSHGWSFWPAPIWVLSHLTQEWFLSLEKFQGFRDDLPGTRAKDQPNALLYNICISSRLPDTAHCPPDIWESKRHLELHIQKPPECSPNWIIPQSSWIQ